MLHFIYNDGVKIARVITAAFAAAYAIYYAFTPAAWHFIDNANLIFHEAGHSIFFLLGDFIRIAAGSGLQIAIPLCIAIYFFVSNQRFSGALCLLWVGQNIINVSVYAGDAIRMDLPLLGGESVIHDWNYLLESMGILRYASTVGSFLEGLGMFVILAGILFSFYIVWKDQSRILLPKNL